MILLLGALAARTTLQYNYLNPSSSQGIFAFTQSMSTDVTAEETEGDAACQCSLAASGLPKENNFENFSNYILGNCNCPATDTDLSNNDLWDNTCDCSLSPWDFSTEEKFVEYGDFITDDANNCGCWPEEEAVAE